MLGRVASGGRTTCAGDECERGQVMFIFLVVITVILVIGVIVVDVGLWLSERRQAQSAADLAALAAATELRNSNNAAVARGQDFARRNGFQDGSGGVSVQVNPGYNADPDLVEVIIEEDTPSFFGEIFGLANMSIGARAVAKVADTPLAQDYAVFANRRNSCNPQATLRIHGSSNTVNGRVHSNSDLNIQSANSTFVGAVTYVCQGGFNVATQAPNTSYNPPPQRVSSRQPPIDYNFSQIPCTRTFSGPHTQLETISNLWVNNTPTSNQLKDNVICSDGNITLDRNNVSGNVTIASEDGRVTLKGDNYDLWPVWNNLLIYSERSSGGNIGCGIGNPAIQMETDDGVFRGFIHAPDGAIEFEQPSCLPVSGNQVLGSVVGDRVRINGNGNTFDASGAGQTPPPPTIWLIE